jgi:hypothetical protein
MFVVVAAWIPSPNRSNRVPRRPFVHSAMIGALSAALTAIDTRARSMNVGDLPPAASITGVDTFDTAPAVGITLSYRH